VIGSGAVKYLADRPLLLAGLALAGACLVGCGGGHPATTVSVVTISAEGCRPFSTFATGIVVDTDLVLTVAHAVAGETTITVTAADGRALSAAAVAVDTVEDGALLAVRGLGTEPRPTIAPGAAGAATLLTPAGSAPVDIVRAVQITTQDIYRAGSYPRPGFELRAEVSAGDSGGAVIDSKGRLVGMVFAGSRDAPERSWATSVDRLLASLDGARDDPGAADARCSR
jgi:S1-C subfamily serine protease